MNWAIACCATLLAGSVACGGHRSGPPAIELGTWTNEVDPSDPSHRLDLAVSACMEDGEGDIHSYRAAGPDSRVLVVDVEFCNEGMLQRFTEKHRDLHELGFTAIQCAR